VRCPLEGPVLGVTLFSDCVLRAAFLAGFKREFAVPVPSDSFGLSVSWVRPLLGLELSDDMRSLLVFAYCSGHIDKDDA